MYTLGWLIGAILPWALLAIAIRLWYLQGRSKTPHPNDVDAVNDPVNDSGNDPAKGIAHQNQDQDQNTSNQ